MIFPLHLFKGIGIELEYMIVDKQTLKVKPITDKVIYEITNEYVSDVEFEKIAWSNELVLHVIEFKTNGPADSFEGLSNLFEENVSHVNRILEKYNAMLLPGGAHPLMDPYKETKLWPHENNPVYESYNRIFDCRGHGWSNLQSTHINLPFFDDYEFEKLHAAIRLLLPIIPALTASTPILDGKQTGFLDTRLEVYRNNQIKIPSITGKVIPEKVYSKKEYEDKIFQRIYNDIKPFDPENILQYEWLNSRGAIARFDRNTIEIRIIDIQEAPIIDIALVYTIVETLKLITNEKWIDLSKQKLFEEENLKNMLLDVIKNAEETIITDKEFLSAFGLNQDKIRAKDLWKHILNEIKLSNKDLNDELLKISLKVINEGTLARRILTALNGDFSEKNIINIYKKLSDSLANNNLFIP